MVKKTSLILLIIITFISLAYLAYALTSVTLNVPATGANISGTILLNATTDDNTTSNVTWSFINATGHSVDLTNTTAVDPATNTSWTRSFNTSTIPDGIYNVTINATNSTGHSVFNTSTGVTVDNTGPSIVLNSPADPSIFRTAARNFNITPTDNLGAYLDCNLTVNNSIVNTTSGIANGSSFIFNYTLPNDGTFPWNVTCYDPAGNSNTSLTYDVTLNTTAGHVTINVPVTATFYRSDIIVSVTTSTGASSVAYMVYNATGGNVTGWTNLTNTSANAWNATFDITSQIDGNYSFRINITDDLSNVNDTTNVTDVRIDDTSPSISSFTLIKGDRITRGESLTSADFRCSASDNSATFGGSASTSITGLDTTTTGDKIAICTATDTAGNSATANLDYTVRGTYTAPSGGGGGRSVTRTQIFAATEARKIVKFDRLDSVTNVLSIEINISNDVKNAGVTVKKHDYLPTDIKPTERKVFTYLEISTLNIKYADIESADITFRVTNGFMDSNNITKDEIILLRYVSEAWQELETSFVKEDGGFFVFKAESPGLSYFAVVGKIEVEAKEEVFEEIAEKPEAKFTTFVVTAIVIAVLLMATYLLTTKKEKNKLKKK